MVFDTSNGERKSHDGENACTGAFAVYDQKGICINHTVSAVRMRLYYQKTAALYLQVTWIPNLKFH